MVVLCVLFGSEKLKPIKPKLMDKETIEGNKLIAEFLGYKIWYKNGNEVNIETSPERCEPITTWAKYHTCWSELMPVLEKISRLKVGDGIEYVEYCYPRTFGMIDDETCQVMVRLNGCQLFKADTLIEATWLAVVDFCKHQNEKNNGCTSN